jgi:hypothetical protein
MYDSGNRLPVYPAGCCVFAGVLYVYPSITAAFHCFFGDFLLGAALADGRTAKRAVRNDSQAGLGRWLIVQGATCRLDLT